jgi:tetratricopeptide (TPR) repeat protein
LARALSDLDDARARSVWQEVLEEEPENSQAYSYFASEAAKSGDRDKAIVLAKKADKLASSKEDILNVAALYHEWGEFQTAIKKYLEVIKLFKFVPDRGWVYARIADCYLSMGQISLARKYLKRALKYCPDDEYVKEIQRECEEKSAK